MTVSLSTTPSWGSVSSLGVVTLLVLKSFGAAIQHEVLEIRPDLVEVLLLLVHVLQLALGQVHCIPFLQGEGATARCRRGPPGKTQKTPERSRRWHPPLVLVDVGTAARQAHILQHYSRHRGVRDAPGKPC